MTNPGERREGPWVPFGGHEVRVDVRRGWDCRYKCEHVDRPKEWRCGEGQQGDEWYLQVRRGDVALQLILFSWIRNGAVVMVPGLSQRPLIYGAYLSLHDGRPNGGDRQGCHMLAQGCVPEVMSLLRPDEIWKQEHSDLFEKVALAPIDRVDLELAAFVLEPFWPTLIAELEMCAKDERDEPPNPEVS